MVTISSDGSAQVWNAHTGKPVNPPMIHNGHFCQMVVRDKILMTFAEVGSNGYRRRLWDLRTGHPLTVPLGSGFGLATMSRNAESVVVTSSYFGEIQSCPIAVDNRSVQEILATAEVLSGYRLDPQSGRIPLSARDFHDRFRAVADNSAFYWASSSQQVNLWKVRQADWHLRLASNAAKDSNLPGKLKHLSRALALLPTDGFKTWEALGDRGRTFAMLSRWEDALRDLNQANSLRIDSRTMYDIAQIYLRLERFTDHKRICTQMSGMFDPRTQLSAKYRLTLTSVLVGTSIDNWDQLAQQLTAPNNPQQNQLRAAVLYRAGKFDESLATFASVPEMLLGAREYFFQAMAHAASERKEEAKTMFAKAEQRIEENRLRMETTHDWQGFLEAELLRKEAQGMIEKP